MKFDEGYPRYMKRGIVQRECENSNCNCMTFWRYHHKTSFDEIFFAACSNECLERILKLGLRNPAGKIMIPIEPKKAVRKAIAQSLST